jgi:hypothetical protein
MFRLLSDFFLFGTLQTELQNHKMHSRQDLILAIRAVFDEIPKGTLDSVEVSERKRPKWLIQNEGRHFSKWLKKRGFSV